MTAKHDRKKLIRELQKLRGSRVLCYLTADRAPIPAQIGDDAMRPIFDHLRGFGHVSKLDFFIYSRGGAIDVPWRIVSALRRASDTWNILIPYRANSAATLIALGADQIVLGPQGELGPIDPNISIQRTVSVPGGGQSFIQDNVSVEDVMAYVRFAQERAGLSDQTALSESLNRLTERLDAVGLGNVYRTYSHIRDVARRVLLSRKEPAKEQVLMAIIETLAERVYAHGHAIGLKDAQEIGLPAVAPTMEEDRLMWQLFEGYEAEMKIRQPLDPVGAIGTSDLYSEPGVLAIVESDSLTHSFKGEHEVRARRQPAPAINLNLNVNLQLPPGLDPSRITPQIQAQLQQLVAQAQQAAAQQALQSVTELLRAQALLGAETAFRNGRWHAED